MWNFLLVELCFMFHTNLDFGVCGLGFPTFSPSKEQCIKIYENKQTIVRVHSQYHYIDRQTDTNTENLGQEKQHKGRNDTC